MAQRIERTLEGAIGDAFARVFGGNLQVTEVQAGLQREAATQVQPGPGGAPVTADQYTIRLGQADQTHLAEHYQHVTKMLSRHLEQFITAQGWSTVRPVSVLLEVSQTMRAGQLRVFSSITGAPGPAQSHIPQRPIPQSPIPQPSVPQSPMPPRAPSTTQAPLSARQSRRRVMRLTEGTGRQHQLAYGTTKVGRGARAEVRLDDSAVSREHFQIWWDGERAVLQDLGSTNGTQVNGERVAEWQLADGDVVNVGQSLLIVRFG